MLNPNIDLSRQTAVVTGAGRGIGEATARRFARAPMAMFSDWRGGIPFWTYLPLYVVSVIALSFLFTRVWLIGRGSLVPIIWLHGIVNAIGPMAFNNRVWTSPWSQEAAVLFFAAAGLIAAASLAKATR